METVEALELYRPGYLENQGVESLGQKWCFLIEKFLKTWKKIVEKSRQDDTIQGRTFSQGDYGTQLSCFWRF